MNQKSTIVPELKERQRWMRVLAMAPVTALEDAWQALDDRPDYTLLRAPEVGSAMVRARAGGSGGQFNMGEMTVTRCVVRLSNGTAGHAYVAGRDKRKTELAAAFDAILQGEDRRIELLPSLIVPLENKQQTHRHIRAQKVQATRVNFFTMVRGDNQR
ncbi:MAG: phosphonate C-P lyase system protein PhnG [Rhodospirillales bacterium]|nr:phosphonate C-P lyase system protein PhnG [Rhodospirillales bacterium]